MYSLYKLFLQHPLISTDTRNISPNSIFICLKGDHFDGNEFALQALEKGAAYTVTEDHTLNDNPRCIVVDDCLKTLQDLSLYYRKQLQIPIIGITGTNGKTTTKELIAAVLSKKYKTAFTKGNLNNHIGVPLTLLSIKPDDQIAIVEMGANHSGEIADLCELALPDYGIITNIGKAHIEGFGSIENIITAKTALYKSVIKRNGTLFVNAADPLLRKYANHKNLILYGQNQSNGIPDKVMKMTPFLELTLFNQKLKTNLTGFYNLYNILCAAAVGQFFDIPENDILDALACYIPSNNRSQIVNIGSNVVIADYYNANPASMEVAIQNLDKIDHPHKAAILGDMFELGNISSEEHIRIINLCKALSLQACFIGKEFYQQHPDQKYYYYSVEDFNNATDKPQFENALILIKGSRGVHLEKIDFLNQGDKNES